MLEIFNGSGSLWGAITGAASQIGPVNVIMDTVNGITQYNTDYFEKLGYTIGSAIGQVLYPVFQEPMGFLAGILHFLQLVGDLVNYLIAPFWYIAKFLAGFFSYVSMPAAIVASNNAYTNGAINNFLLNFPGYSEVIIIINAALWAMLAFHVLRELKHI